MSDEVQPVMWDHKDEWRLKGEDFTVLVSRHNKGDGAYGGHGWCVYAIVQKEHRLFAKLDVGHDEDYYVIEALNCLPLHGGCTYFERLRYDKDGDGKYGRDWKRGDTYAFKVGCDYGHLHDGHYSEYATKSEASGVFYDAEELFNRMTTKREESCP